MSKITNLPRNQDKYTQCRVIEHETTDFINDNLFKKCVIENYIPKQDNHYSFKQWLDIYEPYLNDLYNIFLETYEKYNKINPNIKKDKLYNRFVELVYLESSGNVY